MINAPHDKEFQFHDGTRVKNLLELVSKIENLSDHEFHHFVNPHNNDFSNWIEHVLLDKNFADRLRGMHSKDDIVQLIKDRISDITIGNSIIKVPKIEDHSGHHEITNEINKHLHDTGQDTRQQKEHELSHEQHHAHELHEPSVLDQVPPLVVSSKHHERLEESKSRRGWFRFLSKDKVSGKDLERIGSEEKDKFKPEAELTEEIISDEKENALWTVLYIVLVVLIITLLAYKLFL